MIYKHPPCIQTHNWNSGTQLVFETKPMRPTDDIFSRFDMIPDNDRGTEERPLVKA